MSVLPPQSFPILRLLSPDAFISGETIAQRLKCSRATVHNAIQAVLATGFSVHAVHGRGYRLAAPVSWLDPAHLNALFAQRGITLQLYDQLASTNAQMLHWAARDWPERAPHRALVGAEWQSQGRGRRGRDWHAGLGGGLTFSFLWRSARPAAQLSGLSLAVGVALVQALREIGLAEAQVKWPNDIQLGGAKLAGVLIELANTALADGHLASDVLGPSSAVIGVGLNVRGGDELTRRVGQPVTDLQAHWATGGGVDRNALLLALVSRLDAELARFEQDGFAAFHDDWQRLHAQQGQPVCLQPGQGEAICGVALGVDAQGALRLQTPAGIRAFHSGEISLRAALP